MKVLPKLVILAIVTIWLAVLSLPDNKLHVIFCNVGQGDATLITYKNNQILVDGGPDDSVIKCLSKHIPFYDKKIEAVILTHENSDHSEGLKQVKERYSFDYWEPFLRKGQIIKTGPVSLIVEWPDDRLLEKNIISEKNDLGIVGKINYGQFDVLMMADVSTKNILTENGIEVLKVPHHGSATGMDKEWINSVRPQMAVISVGKNSFGHPSSEIIKILEEANVRILRTDVSGDIEIVSDGTVWRVK